MIRPESNGTDISLTETTLGLIGFAFGIPVLGWVAGLVGIAAWLAKAFLFREDTPVEAWINNGPFARGDEYHETFYYNRSTTIKKVKDDKGNWVDTACTVHRYDNFEFLVDSAGTLVHAGPSQFHSPIQRCRVAPDGTVYLKAGKWYSLPGNKHHEIPADTTVATIGQPFCMHDLLKPHVKAKTASNSQSKNAKNNVIKWRHPHDAYLALADAVYRPRVTLTEISSNADTQCVLKLKLPFYLPGKSLLFIEFGEKDQNLRTFDPGSIDNLKVGSGEYEIVEKFPYWETKSFTAKVRLELLGKGDVQLPHESLFCRADIETQIDEHTTKGIQSRTETKWIVAEKKVTGKVKTNSKLEAYVDVMLDNVKSIF